MKLRLFFFGMIISYCLLMVPFTDYLARRPVEVKLGYLPHPQILRATSGAHRPTVSEMMTLRVLFYYGTILQKAQDGIFIRPEFLNMYKTLQGAVHLDPYNMDAYYFAQAAFTWELGRIHEVNHLLEIGMKSRTWDYMLPYYLGFNYAYFIKDYEKAARYMKQAAELSGNPLFTRLASRYFFESEQSSLGLAFLETMIKNAKNEAVKKTYIQRRDALQAVILLEGAVERYRSRFGEDPSILDELIKAGVLASVPEDPYGGSFYIDDAGRVRTSSKFASPIF